VAGASVLAEDQRELRLLISRGQGSGWKKAEERKAGDSRTRRAACAFLCQVGRRTLAADTDWPQSTYAKFLSTPTRRRALLGLRRIAEAQGMSRVAEARGSARELYRSLSGAATPACRRWWRCCRVAGLKPVGAAGSPSSLAEFACLLAASRKNIALLDEPARPFPQSRSASGTSLAIRSASCCRTGGHRSRPDSLDIRSGPRRGGLSPCRPTPLQWPVVLGRAVPVWFSGGFARVTAGRARPDGRDRASSVSTGFDRPGTAATSADVAAGPPCK